MRPIRGVLMEWDQPWASLQHNRGQERLHAAPAPGWERMGVTVVVVACQGYTVLGLGVGAAAGLGYMQGGVYAMQVHVGQQQG